MLVGGDGAEGAPGAREPARARGAGALAAGAVASAASTLLAAPLLRAVERGPWWPFAAERLALAAITVARSRRAACQDRRR